MSTKRRKRHSPEQIVKKLRDAEAMLNAGKDLAAVLQARAMAWGRALSLLIPQPAARRGSQCPRQSAGRSFRCLLE